MSLLLVNKLTGDLVAVVRSNPGLENMTALDENLKDVSLSKVYSSVFLYYHL